MRFMYTCKFSTMSWSSSSRFFNTEHMASDSAFGSCNWHKHVQVCITSIDFHFHYKGNTPTSHFKMDYVNTTLFHKVLFYYGYRPYSICTGVPGRYLCIHVLGVTMQLIHRNLHFSLKLLMWLHACIAIIIIIIISNHAWC